MRSLPRMVLILVLGGLLVVTTPVGTGQGIHQSELLHPLLPHLHLVAGRLVSWLQNKLLQIHQ